MLKLRPEILRAVIGQERGEPMEVDQSEHLFGGCRVPGKDTDRIDMYPDSRHVVVLAGGSAFPVGVTHLKSCNSHSHKRERESFTHSLSIYTHSPHTRKLAHIIYLSSNYFDLRCQNGSYYSLSYKHLGKGLDVHFPHL